MKGEAIWLERRDWAIIAAVSFFGTVLCVVLTLMLDYPHFSTLPEAAKWQAIENDIVIPCMLAPPFFLFLTYKIRMLEHAKRQLTRLATTDGLTGLLNRGAFAERVTRHLNDYADVPSYTHAVFVIDVDHFKAVNDSYGHDRGDAALQAIAEAISASLREQDVAARLGGEEFGVFVPHVNAGMARLMANHVLTAIAAIKFAPDGKDHPLTVSIGIALAHGGTNYGDVYKSADRALYAAKHAGRNRVVEHPAVAYAA